MPKLSAVMRQAERPPYTYATGCRRASMNSANVATL